MVVYIPGVTTGLELTCDVSSGVVWIVNGNAYLLNRLQNGSYPGHNANGRNILITINPTNNSRYVCSDGINDGGVYRIFVVGEYAIAIHMYVRICRACIGSPQLQMLTYSSVGHCGFCCNHHILHT